MWTLGLGLYSYPYCFIFRLKFFFQGLTMRIKDVHKAATMAWSPANISSVYVAAGSTAGQDPRYTYCVFVIDCEYKFLEQMVSYHVNFIVEWFLNSVKGKLEILAVEPADSSLDLPQVGYISTDVRYRLRLTACYLMAMWVLTMVILLVIRSWHGTMIFREIIWVYLLLALPILRYTFTVLIVLSSMF